MTDPIPEACLAQLWAVLFGPNARRWRVPIRCRLLLPRRGGVMVWRR